MRTIPVNFSCLMCGLETERVRLGSPSRRSDHALREVLEPVLR